jgi:hypothetical protein
MSGPQCSAGNSDAVCTCPVNSPTGKGSREACAKHGTRTLNEPQEVPDRQKVIDLIGYHFAVLVSGNNQPHMSGDPRARLLPHVRRRFDDACEATAEAILALSRPQRVPQ